MEPIRDRLTYSNVVATLALFVALGGGAYAAIKLPANSVGSKQLKTHAVTPKKVAPATVALFKGQKGDKGDPGPQGGTGSQGPQGLQGLQGVQGPVGPSNAYFGASGSSQSSVTVPAGAYILNGACEFSAGGTGTVDTETITSGVTGGIGSGAATVPASGDAMTVADASVQLTTGTTIYNDCTFGAGGAVPRNTITAFEVGNLSQ